MMKNKATAMQNNKIKVTMNNNNYNRKVDKPKINSKIRQNNCLMPITKNKFLIKMKAMTKKRLLIKMIPMTKNRFLIKIKTITKLRILTNNQNKAKIKQQKTRKNTTKKTKPTQATSKTTQARPPNLHQATNHHLYSQTKITHLMNNHNTLINNQINIMIRMTKKIRKKFKIMRIKKGKIVNILKGSLRKRRMIMGMFLWNWIDSDISEFVHIDVVCYLCSFIAFCLIILTSFLSLPLLFCYFTLKY